MTQPALHLFGDVCGEQFSFTIEWRHVFARLGIDDAALFCSLPRGHEGQHIDEKSSIPWDDWEGA